MYITTDKSKICREQSSNNNIKDSDNNATISSFDNNNISKYSSNDLNEIKNRLLEFKKLNLATKSDLSKSNVNIEHLKSILKQKCDTIKNIDISNHTTSNRVMNLYSENGFENENNFTSIYINSNKDSYTKICESNNNFEFKKTNNERICNNTTSINKIGDAELEYCSNIKQITKPNFNLKGIIDNYDNTTFRENSTNKINTVFTNFDSKPLFDRWQNNVHTLNDQKKTENVDVIVSSNSHEEILSNKTQKKENNLLGPFTNWTIKQLNKREYKASPYKRLKTNHIKNVVKNINISSATDSKSASDVISKYENDQSCNYNISTINAVETQFNNLLNYSSCQANELDNKSLIAIENISTDIINNDHDEPTFKECNSNKSEVFDKDIKNIVDQYDHDIVSNNISNLTNSQISTEPLCISNLESKSIITDYDSSQEIKNKAYSNSKLAINIQDDNTLYKIDLVLDKIDSAINNIDDDLSNHFCEKEELIINKNIDEKLTGNWEERLKCIDDLKGKNDNIEINEDIIQKLFDCILFSNIPVIAAACEACTKFCSFISKDKLYNNWNQVVLVSISNGNLNNARIKPVMKKLVATIWLNLGIKYNISEDLLNIAQIFIDDNNECKKSLTGAKIKVITSMFNLIEYLICEFGLDYILSARLKQYISIFFTKSERALKETLYSLCICISRYGVDRNEILEYGTSQQIKNELCKRIQEILHKLSNEVEYNLKPVSSLLNIHTDAADENLTSAVYEQKSSLDNFLNNIDNYILEYKKIDTWCEKKNHIETAIKLLSSGYSSNGDIKNQLSKLLTFLLLIYTKEVNISVIIAIIDCIAPIFTNYYNLISDEIITGILKASFTKFKDKNKSLCSKLDSLLTIICNNNISILKNELSSFKTTKNPQIKVNITRWITIYINNIFKETFDISNENKSFIYSVIDLSVDLCLDANSNVRNNCGTILVSLIDHYTDYIKSKINEVNDKKITNKIFDVLARILGDRSEKLDILLINTKDTELNSNSTNTPKKRKPDENAMDCNFHSKSVKINNITNNKNELKTEQADNDKEALTSNEHDLRHIFSNYEDYINKLESIDNNIIQVPPELANEIDNLLLFNQNNEQSLVINKILIGYIITNNSYSNQSKIVYLVKSIKANKLNDETLLIALNYLRNNKVFEIYDILAHNNINTELQFLILYYLKTIINKCTSLNEYFLVIFTITSLSYFLYEDNFFSSNDAKYSIFFIDLLVVLLNDNNSEIKTCQYNCQKLDNNIKLLKTLYISLYMKCFNYSQTIKLLKKGGFDNNLEKFIWQLKKYDYSIVKLNDASLNDFLTAAANISNKELRHNLLVLHKLITNSVILEYRLEYFKFINYIIVNNHNKNFITLLATIVAEIPIKLANDFIAALDHSQDQKIFIAHLGLIVKHCNVYYYALYYWILRLNLNTFLSIINIELLCNLGKHPFNCFIDCIIKALDNNERSNCLYNYPRYSIHNKLKNIKWSIIIDYLLRNVHIEEIHIIGLLKLLPLSHFDSTRIIQLLRNRRNREKLSTASLNSIQELLIDKTFSLQNISSKELCEKQNGNNPNTYENFICIETDVRSLIKATTIYFSPFLVNTITYYISMKMMIKFDYNCNLVNSNSVDEMFEFFEQYIDLSYANCDINQLYEKINKWCKYYINIFHPKYGFSYILLPLILYRLQSDYCSNSFKFIYKLLDLALLIKFELKSIKSHVVRNNNVYIDYLANNEINISSILLMEIYNILLKTYHNIKTKKRLDSIKLNDIHKLARNICQYTLDDLKIINYTITLLDNECIIFEKERIDLEEYCEAELVLLDVLLCMCKKYNVSSNLGERILKSYFNKLTSSTNTIIKEICCKALLWLYENKKEYFSKETIINFNTYFDESTHEQAQIKIDATSPVSNESILNFSEANTDNLSGLVSYIDEIDEYKTNKTFDEALTSNIIRTSDDICENDCNMFTPLMNKEFNNSSDILTCEMLDVYNNDILPNSQRSAVSYIVTQNTDNNNQINILNKTTDIFVSSNLDEKITKFKEFLANTTTIVNDSLNEGIALKSIYEINIENIGRNIYLNEEISIKNSNEILQSHSDWPVKGSIILMHCRRLTSKNLYMINTSVNYLLELYIKYVGTDWILNYSPHCLYSCSMALEFVFSLEEIDKIIQYSKLLLQLINEIIKIKRLSITITPNQLTVLFNSVLKAMTTHTVWQSNINSSSLVNILNTTMADGLMSLVNVSTAACIYNIIFISSVRFQSIASLEDFTIYPRIIKKFNKKLNTKHSNSIFTHDELMPESEVDIVNYIRLIDVVISSLLSLFIFEQTYVEYNHYICQLKIQIRNLVVSLAIYCPVLLGTYLRDKKILITKNLFSTEFDSDLSNDSNNSFFVWFEKFLNEGNISEEVTYYDLSLEYRNKNYKNSLEIPNKMPKFSLKDFINMFTSEKYSLEKFDNAVANGWIEKRNLHYLNYQADHELTFEQHLYQLANKYPSIRINMNNLQTHCKTKEVNLDKIDEIILRKFI